MNPWRRADLPKLLVHIAAAVFGQAHEGLCGQQIIAHPGGLGTGVVLGAHQAVKIGPQFTTVIGTDVLQILQNRKGHIIGPLFALLPESVGIPPVQLHPSLGILLLKPPHQLGQEMPAGAVQIADLQNGGAGVLRLVHPLPGPLLQVQHPLGVLQKEFPGPGQGDAAGGAMQQLDPQILFQGGDLVGDGGLGQIELLGRLGEIAVPGYRQEIAELFHSHKACPPVMENPPGRGVALF